MKNYFKKKAIIFLFSVVIIFLGGITEAQVSDTTTITAQVGMHEIICNGDGICGPGETPENCPSDCASIFNQSDTFLFIKDLKIENITFNSAVISWDTTNRALCQLYFGEEEEYKEKVVSEFGYSLSHSIILTELFSHTDYHFKISCSDMLNKKVESQDYKFSTLAYPSVILPQNVSNLRAIGQDRQILLSWKNPNDANFRGVKIIRNESFYPADINDGILIYDGEDISFTDKGLENNKKYYYTIFSYDEYGNYSSGAAVSAVAGQKEEIISPEELPKAEVIPLEISDISLKDFDFIYQGSKIIIKSGGKIEIEAGSPLTISLLYERVPEVLKTIMATLEKEKKYFSFLLRINNEKTSYSATFIAPEEAGTYPLTITIFDYKNKVLKNIKAELVVLRGKNIIKTAVLNENKISIAKIFIFLAILLIIMLIILKRYLKKRKKKKDLEIKNVYIGY